MEKRIEYVNNLMIEVTRRCQLQCNHCLRGNAQMLNIKHEYIDAIMRKVSNINELTITGGEPALNVGAINHIIKAAKENQVSISNFYLATNGVSAKPNFITALLDLYLYCDDNSITAVNISNDSFHKDAMIKDSESARLKCLTFVEDKFAHEVYPDQLLAEGRSRWRPGRVPSDDGFTVEANRVDEGLLYLNCKGEIISGCDFSYVNQHRHKVCDVEELSIDSLRQYHVSAGYKLKMDRENKVLRRV